MAVGGSLSFVEGDGEEVEVGLRGGREGKKGCGLALTCGVLVPFRGETETQV